MVDEVRCQTCRKRQLRNDSDVLYEWFLLVVGNTVLTVDEEFDADRLGVFETMYDDSPNFQIQIKELGSRERWKELQDRRMAEEQQHEVKRLRRLGNVEAVEGDTGSQWSAAPASADLSAPDQGVAGVMVAAVGSLQESGFAARRAASRLKEMQTSTYLEAARRRRDSFRPTP
ncbi:hypothetical protein AK812_SmicGene38370 [Symbiodinium microadriaticum]|uniref:Uncharacterized protein n=1 Tax=Symbiodinium microadriaticum TaxID=2951 RepID=A0A1Q9CDW0_SYMMI|nr:hypothetical protein AK812_SmicGene38370 [Symbiodinium microadriaticum]